ncbi:MAG: hypothetical protein B7Y80_03425 [Hyphomicrobium sp. 32-62-53]|nr:MAG: hypothetical protein B7Z29_06845 [Hyphomicrobium sp. 12-62-95]OYY00976.1 MAG: hypothetical protein B7Y80_03425 [Hyphomicrobium sp. 32-62-53]
MKIDVLANDNDSDGDMLTASLKTSAANGSVSKNADGTFTYTANAGFIGNDSFTYEASDGKGGTAIGTVNVTVKAPTTIHASIVGSDAVKEGETQSYRVQLDQAAENDTYYTIQVNNGSAKWVSGSQAGVGAQDIMWEGRLSVANMYGQILYYKYNEVPIGTQFNEGFRAMVGPGDASWDYSTFKDGQVTGQTIVVKIPAGQTTSDSFEVKAWSEKITTDGFIHAANAGQEVNETLKLDITNISGADANCEIIVDKGERTVTITDTTAIKRVSPVALDLNNDGEINVTGATTAKEKDDDAELGRTVQFDIDADGNVDTIEWLAGTGDGLLVDNRDGNAASDMNGARLFGDEGGKYANGYDKLALLDADKDGQLAGAELDGLQVWVDNGDAVVQDGELKSLADAGIATVSTKMGLVTDASGRELMQSTATAADGSIILTEDVWFAEDAGAATQVSMTDDNACTNLCTIDPNHDLMNAA